jgi:excisionase family DNA binding protein
MRGFKMPTPKLLRAKEVAEILNITVATVRAWVLHRKISYVKLSGGSIRIPLTEVERLVCEGTIPAREVSTNA